MSTQPEALPVTELVSQLRDIAEASDNFGIQAMARPVVKYYLAYPRWLGAEWFG